MWKQEESYKDKPSDYYHIYQEWFQTYNTRTKKTVTMHKIKQVVVVLFAQIKSEALKSVKIWHSYNEHATLWWKIPLDM